jgi:hypothetical protein
MEAGYLSLYQIKYVTQFNMSRLFGEMLSRKVKKMV